MKDKRITPHRRLAEQEPRKLPIPILGWDASRAAGSFRAFAASVHEQAKQVLVRDGHHSEMFFFVPLDGNAHIVLWRNDDRDLEAEWLRKHIAEQYAFGVVHVVESWIHFASGPNDHTLKQLMDGEMKVSHLKPEHRGEALMVSAQSRDGWANSWVDEIMRDPAGKPLLGAGREIGDFRGRFGKVFG